ncbi:MAG: hypothetical protein ISP72_05510 [Flavobacteriaceae bacterium]|nr:hypothetical protein [Flavobacteriaceae bacterium]|tara:strand:- start:16 stop:237 length:222 start_codon:yes stop_codon:yes gene_type:complete
MKFTYLILLLLFITSCVSVRFPEEVKVNVTFPENMSEESISELIDKIPSSLNNRNVKTNIEVVTNRSAKKTQE